MNTLPNSILTKNQKRSFTKHYTEGGKPMTIIATVRHDDECGNGHNSSSVTGEIYESYVQRGEPTVKHSSGETLYLSTCGCIHEEISKHFPELRPLIKWHLTSTDGPMHYVANTVYHVENRNYNAARAAAVWPEATDAELSVEPDELERKLLARLPALMVEFKAAVESLGFTY